MKTQHQTVLAALLLGIAAGPASAQPEEGSLYEVTMQMELVGLPVQMPEQTTQVCGPKEHLGRKMVPHDENCSITRFEVEGNTTRYTLVCTGPSEMTAEGEFEQLASGGYRGEMNMVGSANGQSMEMNMQFEGKRIGTCDYVPPAAPGTS